jgi:hypothetical protein
MDCSVIDNLLFHISGEVTRILLQKIFLIFAFITAPLAAGQSIYSVWHYIMKPFVAPNE